MRIITHVFAAAGTAEYNIGGRYLRLIATGAPVDLVPLEAGREMTDEKATAVEAGFATRPVDGFDGFRITSSVAQTVRVAVTSGSGSYDRTTGDVNVLGTVPVSGPLTDAQLRAAAVPVSGPLTDAQLRAALLDVRAISRYTNTYVSQGASAANAVYTVVAPASNTNGLIVWTATSFSQGAAPPFISLTAHTSTPANIGNGDTLAIADVQTGSGANALATLALRYPVFVPAGKGLYFLVTAADNYGQRHVLYSQL